MRESFKTDSTSHRPETELLSPATFGKATGLELETPKIQNLEVEQLRARTNLFDLGQMDVRWEPELDCLWAWMTPQDKPNYNPGMLRDTLRWQDESARLSTEGLLPVKYMVLGSRFPRIFNLGGDLSLFAECIERRDHQALVDYGYLCVDNIFRAWHSNNVPVINIALAQGDALGGGFEALLCFDVIIAERHAKFGLPEILFGLFPGMGASSILTRRIGAIATERMLREGRVMTAEELYDLGLVTQLVETGEGEEAARDYICSTRERHAGYVGGYRAARRINPLTLDELRDIVDLWAETALQLSENELRTMRRLANAQTRLHKSSDRQRGANAHA